MGSRESGLDVVRRLLHKVKVGDGGGIALVEGEPGSGKSLLLGLAAEAAVAGGFSLVGTAAEELGRYIPFAPLLTAMTELPYSMPSEEGDALDLPERRLWLIQQIRVRLEKQAGAGPVLVTLDDLHWADPGTLLALRTLPRDLAAQPVVWVLARRSTGPAGDAGRLFELLEREGAYRIGLSPLGDDAVAALLTEQVGLVPGAELLSLAAGASGNPSLLLSLAAGLRDEGRLDLSGAQARLVSPLLPESLHTVVRHRLDGLTPRARHLLDTAAVLGPTFAPGDVAEMLGESPAALWPCLEEALTAGILAVDADELAFKHELIRRVIEAALPAPVRRALHRQAGEVLMDRGGSLVAAPHLAEGARPGDLKALAELDQAVADTVLTSPGTAADLAIRALEMTEPCDSQWFPRMASATEACTVAGRLDLAAALARRALDRAPPAQCAARLHCALSMIFYLGGRAAQARDEAETALTEAGLPAPLREQAELAMLNALAALPDIRPAGERATAILDAAGTWGDPVVVEALTVRSAACWDEGDLAEALMLARESVRLASGGSAEARRRHPRLALAAMLADVHLMEEADAVVAAAADEVQSLGHLSWSGGPGAVRARIYLAQGRLQEAAAEATGVLEIAASQGTHLFSALALAILGTAAVRRGDLRTADRCMADERSLLSGPAAAHARDRCLLVRAQIAEIRSGPEAALRLIDELFGELPRRKGALIADPAAAAWLVRVALAAGRRDRAAAVVAAAEGIALANPGFAATAAAAAHARGVLDRDPRVLERAAADHCDPWARASAAEDLGRLHADGGRRRQAVPHLEAALRGYEQTDAARDAARVRSRLRRIGVRHRHWAARPDDDRPVSGWASLTETEQAVSLLVAEGLTNQQVADQMFLSVHTIAFHLRQVFRKLEIGSRVDLTRLVLERGKRQRRTGADYPI